MKKIILSIALIFSVMCSLGAQDMQHKATIWGCKSDGVTDNTGSIQRAIDWISENGGGTLYFYVGRYLTGSFQLKDNVKISLGEGAVLVASTNYYDYKGAPALVWAKDAKNVGIIGLGVIEGRHEALSKQIKDQQAKGYLPEGVSLPSLYSFENCTEVTVSDTIRLLEDTAKSTRYQKPVK